MILLRPWGGGIDRPLASEEGPAFEAAVGRDAEEVTVATELEGAALDGPPSVRRDSLEGIAGADVGEGSDGRDTIVPNVAGSAAWTASCTASSTCC